MPNVCFYGCFCGCGCGAGKSFGARWGLVDWGPWRSLAKAPGLASRPVRSSARARLRLSLRPTLARLALYSGLSLAGLPLAPSLAQADDWQVSRSEFDPRIIAALKAELHRRPEDLALLRRLLGLYRRYRSVDALVAELRESAGAERASGWDAYLVAGRARARAPG